MLHEIILCLPFDKISLKIIPIYILVFLFGLILLNLQVSDAVAHLERTFMSPASIRAISLIRGWMEDAGLSTLVLKSTLVCLWTCLSTKLSWVNEKLDFCRWVDYMGNVHGRVDPKNGSTQALLIGSHLVINSPLGCDLE